MSSGRIAVITFDRYPFEPRALRLAEAAANGANEVDVLCLRGAGEKSFEIYNGVHIYRLPMHRSVGGSLPTMVVQWCLFLLMAGIRVARLHRGRRYDIVHVHNMPDFLVFAALIPKLRGAKVILDVQDVSPELMAAKARGALKPLVKRLALWQEHISTSFADHIVTTGWLFEEILVQRGVPQAKITSILNSVDPRVFPLERLQVAPIRQDRPFILMYHGTLAERNGLDIAIRAVALARHTIPHLELHIQGDGEQLPYLKQLATELGIQNNVLFTPPSPIDTLADFVAHGDVGIIPYRTNGFAELVLPTKGYEYAWMRRPIIASNTRAIRSMFRPGSIALCDPQRPESFADAIIDLYQHPEKRTAMINSAAEDYHPYQWENLARDYQQLLVTLSSSQGDKQYSAV